jgi:putative two-component system response regulator
MMFDSRKKTILAVDDDLTSLTMIRTILEDSYDVSLAKSVDMAKTVLKTTYVDMILLDIEMPHVSGLDFMGFLRQSPDYYYIPVVFVTSHGTAETVVQAGRSGAKDFVVKPVSSKILLDKIETVLRSAPKEISREVLLRRLKTLASICKQGKSSRTEGMAKELEQVYYNLQADREIAEICKYTFQIDYTLVIEKIENLINNNLYDPL